MAADYGGAVVEAAGSRLRTLRLRGEAVARDDREERIGEAAAPQSQWSPSVSAEGSGPRLPNRDTSRQAERTTQRRRSLRCYTLELSFNFCPHTRSARATSIRRLSRVILAPWVVALGLGTEGRSNEATIGEDQKL
jgi:hypothetical protein